MNVRFLTVFFLLILSAGNALHAQLFRTADDGNWSDNSIWLRSNDGGTVWFMPTVPPDYSNSTNIRIRSGDTITVNADVTVDQMVIDAGGYVLNNASLTINDGALTDLEVNGIFEQAAAVYGSGSLYVGNGTLLWTNGTMSGSGALSFGSAARCTLKSNGNSKTISGGWSFTNYGTVVWQNTNFGVYNNSGFVNYGTMEISITNDYGMHESGGGTSFTNNGTITYNSSTGSSFTVWVPFTQNSTLQTQTGLFKIGGGGSSSGTFATSANAGLHFVGNYTVGSGTTFTGDGFVGIYGPTVSFSGATTLKYLQFEGGWITGAGSVSVQNQFNWVAGNFSIGGGMTVSASAVCTVSSNYDKRLYAGSRFENAGTLYHAQGWVILHDSSVYKNSGTYNYSTPYDYGFADGGGTGIRYFENSGTLNKSNTAWMSFYISARNYGTFNVQAGSAGLYYDGFTKGTFSISSGALLRVNTAEFIVDTGAAVSNSGTFEIQGGSLNIRRPSITIDNMNLTGGTLTGGGALSISSSFYWSAGTVQTSSAFTVNSGATLTIAEGYAKYLRGNAQLINNGTVNWSHGPFYLYDDVLFKNSGTLNYTGQYDNSIVPGNSGLCSFENHGTFNKSGAGAWSIYVSNTNYGTMNLQAGNTLIEASGRSKGTFAISSGAYFRINATEYIIDTGAVITNAGTFDIPGGTVNFRNPTMNVPAMNISGGAITGAGAVTISGSLYFSSGTIQTTGNFTIGNSATATFTEGYQKSIKVQNRFINNGTINWNSGTLSVFDAAVFVNNGTMNCTTSFDLGFVEGNSGSHYFENYGTLNKAGAAWLNIGIVSYNYGTYNFNAGNAQFYYNGASRGTIAVASGAFLRLNATEYTLDTGAVINNDGTIDLPGGTLNIAAPSLGIKQLTLNGGTITGTGSATITGSFYWSSGIIQNSGNFNIAAACTATIAEGYSKSLRQQSRFINNGTVQWTYGNVLLNDGAVFRNYGAMNITASNDLALSDGGGTGNRYLENYGTINKTGAAWFYFSIGSYHYGNLNAQAGGTIFAYNGTSRGTFTVSSGATLRFSTSAYTLDTGTVISNSGTIDVPGGTLVISAPTLSVAQLSLIGGNIEGTGTLTIGSSLYWTNGGFQGAVVCTLGTSATSTFTSSGQKTLRGNSRLVNRGIVNWNDGHIILADAAVLQNDGTLNFSHTYDYSITDGGGTGDRKFLNYGTLVKNAAAILSVSIWMTNYGTLNVAAGSLSITYPSTLRGTTSIAGGALVRCYANEIVIDTGAVFSGAGSLELSGGVLRVRHPSASIPNFSLVYGTLTGGAPLTISNSAYWSQATINYPGTITVGAGATLAIAETGSKYLQGNCTLYVAGTANWSNGNIIFWDSSKIINAGVLSVAGGNDRGMYFGGGTGPAAFENPGTLTKSTASNVAIQMPFIHTGTVSVTSGNLYFQGSGSSSGSFELAASTAVHFETSGFSLNSGTLFSGSGTVQLNSGTLTFNTPLTIRNFSLAGGVVNGSGNITVDSNFSWGSGELQGAGSLILAPGCASSFYYTTKYLKGTRKIQNYGTLNWSAGSFVCYNSTSLNNFGTLDMTASSDISFVDGDASGVKSIENTGTINKYSSTNFSIGLPFVNNGTFVLHTGSATTYNQTSSGTFRVKKNATLYLSSGTHTLQEGARFTDSGITRLNGTTSVFCQGSASGVTIDTNASFLLEANGLSVPGKLNVYGTLHCQTYTIDGDGEFILRPGGILVTANTAGIAATGSEGSIRTSTRTFSTGAVYVYNGTTAQWTGSGMPSTVRSLWIENNAGVSLSAGCTVSDSLILRGGRLYVSGATDTLTFGNACVISGTPDASKMVVAYSGKVRKLYNAPGTFTFPIGEETGTPQYSPVRVTFSSGVFSGGSVIADVVNDRFPQNSSPQHYLTRYWTLTQSGISQYTCSVKCFYVDADVHGTESEIVTAKWQPSYWQAYEPANTVENSLSANNLISLSTFTGAEGAFVRDTTYLDITALTEGFYNESLNRMTMRDTFAVVLKESAAPFRTIDSARTVLDSVTFTGRAAFTNAPSGTYYIALMHRNSIETWSKTGGEPVTRGGTLAYNFTTAAARAFGDNMILKNTKWCIYGGDANQDGIVDFSDLVGIDNDSYNFVEGYVPTDLNGDNFVDFSDLALCDNNSFNFISSITPGGQRNPAIEARKKGRQE